MDKEKVLKEATLSEMTQHNPDLVKEIQGQGGTASEMANVRKALGINDTDDAGKAIAEMQQKIREQDLDTELRNLWVPRTVSRPLISAFATSRVSAENPVTASDQHLRGL